MSIIRFEGEHTQVSLADNIKFIAIEGVIGVGKTTLAENLCKHLDAVMIAEQFQTNPFLEKFYLDQKAYAFQTQMFFLLSRHKQYQESFTQNDLFAERKISDYTMEKDMIFATQNLNEDEFAMYSKVSDALNKEIIRPDYVIYLRANIDTLIKRIKKRGRSIEHDIDPDYLRDLMEKYDHHFFHYNKSPLLIVNTDNIDFVKNPNDLDELLKEIQDTPIGKTIYTPESL